MDNTNPNNPGDPGIVPVQNPGPDPASSVDASIPVQNSFNPSGESGQIITDVPQLPVDAGAPASSPWGPPLPPAPAPATPLPESPWPTTAATAADVPTAPTAPPMPQDPAAANPFLQPSGGADFSMPQAPADPNLAQPVAPEASLQTPGMPTVAPDPLNTAFAPSAPAATDNAFAPVMPNPSIPQPVAPGAPNPWDQPTPAEPVAQPITGFVAGDTADSSGSALNPNLNLTQPGNVPQETTRIQDQTVTNNAESAPLDLSAVQTDSPTSPTVSPEQPQPAVTPLPAMGPVENAPTDLSHLIAGDETAPQQTNGVYTPPVAADQSIPVSPTPSPDASSETPPPGKHLNLTKVLLVAGIPIVLIVAALSAYLILGVGQASPSPEDQTSLPVEQTQQNQAPLTNPPQQIVAPSPVTIPEPAASDSALPSVPSPSPEASLSPAMRAAQQKASASPAATASPASSASTSLPN